MFHECLHLSVGLKRFGNLSTFGNIGNPQKRLRRHCFEKGGESGGKGRFYGGKVVFRRGGESGEEGGGEGGEEGGEEGGGGCYGVLWVPWPAR